MGAIENITERIKKDASSKANNIISEAKAEADFILNQAKSELEKEKAALESETDKAIKIQRNRAISEAKLEARKMKLAAKEEVITRAFELGLRPGNYQPVVVAAMEVQIRDLELELGLAGRDVGPLLVLGV